MAYQTRQREPLLDSSTAEAIEKRGKELLGVVLLVLGVMAAMMVGSYTPDDPNWMLATDAPAQNWLGRMGALLAAPLFMIVGWASWGLAIVLLVWGLRFALHRGQERAMSRLIFAPIAVALGAIYAANLTPDAEWLRTHSFGLGGHVRRYSHGCDPHRAADRHHIHGKADVGIHGHRDPCAGRLRAGVHTRRAWAFCPLPAGRYDHGLCHADGPVGPRSQQCAGRRAKPAGETGRASHAAPRRGTGGGSAGRTNGRARYAAGRLARRSIRPLCRDPGACCYGQVELAGAHAGADQTARRDA